MTCDTFGRGGNLARQMKNLMVEGDRKSAELDNFYSDIIMESRRAETHVLRVASEGI